MSPNVSVGAVVGVGCALSMREKFQSSCSSQSMWSNSFTGWPSPTSTHCFRMFIPFERMPKFALLLGRWSPRGPSAFWSYENNHSVWTVCAFIVIVRAYIHASSILYVGIEASIHTCVSCSSMARGHSMGLICSTVWLVFVSNFPEHGFEWWTHPDIIFDAASCHVQTIYT